jgi:ankyrin repeat protein
MTATYIQQGPSYSENETAPQIDPKKLTAEQKVNIRDQNNIVDSSTNSKSGKSSQMPQSKSNVRLAELNMMGQLQQMKMRNLESGGDKGKTGIGTAKTGNPTQEKPGASNIYGNSLVGPEDNDNKTADSISMFRGPGGKRRKLTEKRERLFPRGLLDHSYTARSNWRKLSPKEKRMFVKDEMNARGYTYSFDKNGLKKAAEDGNVNAIRYFMKGDPKMAQKCFLNMVEKGNTKAVETFLEAKMDPNIRDSRGRTPLMLAGNWMTVDALIAQGADANAANEAEGRKTVLMYQAEKGGNVISTKLLDRASNQIDARDDQGRTALMYAASGGIGFTEVEKLIRYGADVNAVDKGKTTPLTKAVVANDVETAKVLMANKAWPGGAWSDGGEAPLTIAVRNGNREMVQTLLDNPYTRVDYPVVGDETLVDIAMKMGREDIANLIRAKAQERIESTMSDIQKAKSGQKNNP